VRDDVRESCRGTGTPALDVKVAFSVVVSRLMGVGVGGCLRHMVGEVMEDTVDAEPGTGRVDASFFFALASTQRRSWANACLSATSRVRGKVRGALRGAVGGVACSPPRIGVNMCVAGGADDWRVALEAGESVMTGLSGPKNSP
jgi:hypothetical protein